MIYENNLYLEDNSSGQIFMNNCGYMMNENQIQINIEEICNNRDISNLSGSLSVELWALSEIYNGNSFSNAYCMANVMIGEILGQHFFKDCQYNLPYSNPPLGNWQLCLMLREFNGQIYETVDYCNFNNPYFVDCKSNIFSDKTISTESKSVNELETDKLNKNITNREDDNKEIIVKVSKIINKINLNTASEEEIVKIKGVSGKLANLIFNNRPFKTSDELMKLKGIGKKLLNTILEQAEI